MTFTGLIDRLDDCLNPIVVKELRQAVKSRMVVGILLGFLGLQLLVLGFMLLNSDTRGSSLGTDWNAGNLVFRWQQGILLVALMIAVPIYASIRLGAERADHNVDLMFISTLRPISIVWGKFFAAVVLGLLIFSICAPFMTFTYLLRGIDIPTILTVLVIDLLAMFYGVMLGLFLASIPGGRGVKVFFCVVGFLILAGTCMAMAEATVEMIRDTGVVDQLVEHWPQFAVSVAGVLGLVGLLALYSVAMISPPSANRILPLRIYLFVAWLGLSASIFLISHFNPAGSPLELIEIYLTLFCPILTLQMLISVCERDRWGYRVTRTIPRRWYLRLPAWLLYTGAGGGVTYSALLLTGSLAASAWWIEAYGPASVGDEAFRCLRQQLVLGLFVYCYGLTAALIRYHFLANEIRTGLNWVVALLLVGLGSSIPPMLAFVTGQMQAYAAMPWWAIASPILALAEFADRSRNSVDEFEGLVYAFLTFWAVLLTVVSVPWYRQQLRRFRPPARQPGPPPLPGDVVLEPQVVAAVSPTPAVSANGEVPAPPAEAIMAPYRPESQATTALPEGS